MKYIITFCLICIFHYGGFSAINSGISGLEKKGDSLYKAGQFQLAGLYFEKVSFLAIENITKTTALIKKADCYLARKEFDNAQNVLSRIFYGELSDSLTFAARSKTALCAYLNSDFVLAESQIILAKGFIPDTSIYIKAYPLFALILNESQKWEEAKSVLKDYIKFKEKDPEMVSKLCNEVNEMYETKKIPTLKNVEYAKKLSMLLPGSGQLYCGYFWEGTLSVGLQLVALGFTGLCIYNKYYFTGATLAFGLFQKFYGGGLNRTEFLAKKRNYTSIRTFNDSRKKFILNLLETKKAP
jgi:tetratricopeptide (TPR) repeat protein